MMTRICLSETKSLLLSVLLVAALIPVVEVMAGEVEARNPMPPPVVSRYEATRLISHVLTGRTPLILSGIDPVTSLDGGGPGELKGIGTVQESDGQPSDRHRHRHSRPRERQASWFRSGALHRPSPGTS